MPPRASASVAIPMRRAAAGALTISAVSDPLLTVSEVASIVRVNPQTVRNWIDRGELASVRVRCTPPSRFSARGAQCRSRTHWLRSDQARYAPTRPSGSDADGSAIASNRRILA